MNTPPDPNMSLWILALSEFYEFIFTRAVNLLQPITVSLVNCNFALSHSDSYITSILTHSMYGWSMKGITFLELCINVLSAFVLKYIFDRTSPYQMELSKEVICIIWELSCRFHPVKTLLADICESKMSTENSGEGCIPNVYSLGVIISSAGLTK